MPQRRTRLFLDFSSLAIGQVLSMLLGFAGFAYLARILAPQSYGLVEYAVGLAGTASIVIEAGLGPLGALGVSRDRNRAPELAADIVLARLLLATLLAPVVGLTSWAGGLGWQAGVLIWLYAASLFAVPFKQDWLLQGLGRTSAVAPAQALRSAAFAAGIYLIVGGTTDLARVGAVEVAAAFSVAAYYVLAQRRAGVPVRVGASIQRSWALIRDGAAVGASNIVWTFMLYAPIFLVTNLSGPTEAAWLGGAQRIVYSLVSFSALYFFSLYPIIARDLHAAPAQWAGMMRSSYRLVAWSSLGGTLMAALAAGWLVAVAYGSAFTTAGSVFSIYVWLFPIRLLSGHARWTLVAAERQSHLLLSEAGAMVTLILAGLLLIPPYGAIGAATAVVVANVVGWASVHMLASRVVGTMPGGVNETLWPLCALAVAAGLARPFGANTALSVSVAAMVYGACAFVMARGLLDDGRLLTSTTRAAR